jgi:hypothetical protein
VDLPPFDLTTNPFYVLGVSPAGPPAEIAAAHDHARREARHGESELAGARHALLTPELRLQAELSWFLYAVPKEVARVTQGLAALKQTGDRAGCAAMLRELVDVDQANLAAHVCASGIGTGRDAEELINAYVALDTHIAAQIVNRRRAECGFPAAGLAEVCLAMAALRRAHVQAVRAWLALQRDPIGRMKHLIGFVIRDPKHEYNQTGYPQLVLLCADLVAACERWMSPDQKRIRDQIAAGLAGQGANLEITVAAASHTLSPPLLEIRDRMTAEMQGRGADLKAAAETLRLLMRWLRRLGAAA